MSKYLIRSLALGAIGLFAAASALAQFDGGWIFCENFENGNNPHSVDWDPANIGQWGIGDPDLVPPMITTTLGISGTTAISKDCYPPNGASVALAGRFGFGSGPTGSIQTDFDDNLMYTAGMPIDPGNTDGYAAAVVNGTKVRYGSGSFNMFFSGISDRYILTEQQLGTVIMNLRIDVLGDAARYDWTITNNSNATAQIGFWSGHWIAMVDKNGDTKGYVEGLPGSRPAERIFVSIPGQRPTQLQSRWFRKQNAALFPAYIDFDWSQELPYGLRIETGPSASTTDPKTNVSDATQADELVLGWHGERESGPGILGDLPDSGADFPDHLFPIVHTEPGLQQADLPYIDNPAYILKFDPTAVPAGGTRKIVQYYRDTWGQSDYIPPYTVVVDAPRLFNYDPNGVNGLTPNPATVRVWIDNILGFTSAEQEIPLTNVRITLDLTKTQGITFAGGGKQQTKTISTVQPRRTGFVDFTVNADGVATGIQPMTVTVVAPPGPTKTLTAFTDISTTPKIPVVEGSNLITMPWQFSDTSWTSILGLSQPGDFQAFQWDPVQQGYVLSTSAERGKGTWIVIQDPSVIPQGILSLAAEPIRPPDMQTGGVILELSRGWNLIGNPYPYPVPLGELIGVPTGQSTGTLRWSSLVDANFVSASLAYWDTKSSPPGYKFISGIDALLQPNIGYWIFVNGTGLTLSFPPVFYEGAITSSSSSLVAQSRLASSQWTQSDKQWHLQFSARTNDEIDDQNFVGVAASADAAKKLTILEPPMGPQQKLGVSIAPSKPGETRMAQSLSTTSGKQSWSVLVQTKTAGPVTLTWPNMSTVPKGIRFRVTDVATGTSRDMRRSSGYTFTSEANATREFKVEAEPGAVSRAVIGNVTIGRAGRDRNAAFTISYTLSADATTTVRILGAGGKEVFTATRGRADRVGENTATWTMRDNANRAVAPGTYRVEITAETTDGERVRKIVPINVIR